VLSIDFSVVGVSNPTSTDSCDVAVTVGSTVTSVRGDGSTPVVVLHQNRPNPFNASTRIDFALGESGPVEFGIYDVSGQLVRTVLARHGSPGAYAQEWDGRDDMGHDVASGIYFFRLTVGSQAITRKAVLVR
jgi:flagellar hook assembly protein FlgD